MAQTNEHSAALLQRVSELHEKEDSIQTSLKLFSKLQQKWNVVSVFQLYFLPPRNKMECRLCISAEAQKTVVSKDGTLFPGQMSSSQSDTI